MAAAAGFATAAPPSGVTLSVEALRRASLAVMVFCGAIVMIEPSPYELLGIVTMLIWSAGGLRLKPETVPILLLLVVDMIGASITLVPVMHLPKTVIWTCVGWFLAFTGFFYMTVLSEDTQARLAILTRAFVASAVVASLIGVAAYARLLPFADSFLLYERVKSTFNDPNVFGPYLVFPIVVLVQRLYIDGGRGALGTMLLLLPLLAGLFLSFSRGAWGHVAASVALMTAMTFFCARSTRLRARIVLMCLVGLGVVALLLAVLLSFDVVAKLFAQRFALEQSYDAGQFGRFNRHWLGFVLALDKPIGIGMLQFAPIFGEDTHNSYLNAFLSYGWIGGIAWPSIVASTLFVGWRTCLVPSPWRPTFICVMATYQVMVLEAWIIDIDHWRHAWLLFGAVWGLSIATARMQRSERAVCGARNVLPGA